MDVRTKQGDIIYFMDALADYIDAKIDYERACRKRPDYANADHLLKTGVGLERALERLISRL